jgi:hypothetical protein
MCTGWGGPRCLQNTKTKYQNKISKQNIQTKKEEEKRRQNEIKRYTQKNKR